MSNLRETTPTIRVPDELLPTGPQFPPAPASLIPADVETTGASERAPRLGAVNDRLVSFLVQVQTFQPKEHGRVDQLMKSRRARLVGAGIIGVAVGVGFAARAWAVVKGIAAPAHAAPAPEMVHAAYQIPVDDMPATSPSPSVSAHHTPSPSVSPSHSVSPSPEVSASKTSSPTPSSASTHNHTPSPAVSTSASPETAFGKVIAAHAAEAVLTKDAPKNTTYAEAVDKFNDTVLQNKPFDKEARTISLGEGWYHQFNDMGIAPKHHHQLLQEIGPELKKRGLAYYDKSHHEWRMNLANPVTDSHGHKHGVIKEKDLQFIHDAAAKHGYLERQKPLITPDHIIVKRGDNLAESTNRAYEVHGISHDEFRAELTHDVIADKALIHELQEAGVLKTKGGKLVMDHGSPIWDFPDLHKHKNGTYTLPSGAERDLEQSMIRQMLEETEEYLKEHAPKVEPSAAPKPKTNPEGSVSKEVTVSILATLLTALTLGIASRSGAFRRRP